MESSPRNVKSRRSEGYTNGVALWRKKFEDLEQLCLQNGTIQTLNVGSPSVSTSTRSQSWRVLKTSGGRQRSATKRQAAAPLTRSHNPRHVSTKIANLLTDVEPPKSRLDKMGNDVQWSCAHLLTGPASICLDNMFDIGQSRADSTDKPEKLGAQFSYVCYSIRRYIIAIVDSPEDCSQMTGLHGVGPCTKLRLIVEHFGSLTSVTEGLADQATLHTRAIYDTITVLTALTYAVERAGSWAQDGVEGARRDQHRLSISLRSMARRNQDSVEPTDSQPIQQSNGQTLNSELCLSLVLKILQTLTPTSSGHHEIFEGFLADLAARIGEQLKWAMDDGDTNAVNRMERPQDGTALLSLLHHMMDMARQRPGLLVGPKTVKNPPAGRLSQCVIERIQNTMLNSACGDESRGRMGPTLQPIALPRAAVRSGVESPKPDPRTTFKKELWRTLGWDVLHRHLLEEARGLIGEV